MHRAEEYYLKIGRAADLKNPKERVLFRSLEILPGFLSWATLIGLIFLCWFRPEFVAVFILFFVFYWLFRTLYFSFHLRATYQKMKQHEKTNWLEKLEGLNLKDNAPGIKNWQDIYHLIVLPMYKETTEIVRPTFQALLKSDWPKDRMLVVLGVEERAGKEAEKTAGQMEKEFGDKFFRFLITLHPANLPGEIAGKGSNDAWATKQARASVIDPQKIPYQNIIVSSLDVDTCVFPRYFSCLSYHYLTSKNPLRSSFQPIPVFLNNIWQTPFISRIFAFSATFWQMMCQERPEKLHTFSSHSMSFQALVDVGFRQTNVVSDDSRIFWQCFLKYNGDYRTVPLYYPISMDANLAPTLFKTLKNIYKQQRRWAYGVGELPYFIFGFIKNKSIPLGKKISLALVGLEAHWSWATNSLILFLFGWLPLFLGGEDFGQTLLAYNLPIYVRDILTIAMLGLISSACFGILLLPSYTPKKKLNKKYLLFVLQWLLFPPIMVLFTALPSLDAQTRWMLAKYMGFWPTEKIRKK